MSRSLAAIGLCLILAGCARVVDPTSKAFIRIRQTAADGTVLVDKVFPTAGAIIKEDYVCLSDGRIPWG